MLQKKNIALTKNISRFLQVFGQLEVRSDYTPGIGLLLGKSGTGKTTACLYLQDQNNCIYFSATPFWTPKTMLQKILEGMGGDTRGNTASLHYQVIELLRVNRRSLIIDNLDLLLASHYSRPLLEGLRTIHDESGMPLLGVAYDDSRGIIKKRYKQFDNRVSKVVNFDDLDLEDTYSVLCQLSKLQIDPCLVRRVFDWTEGDTRLTAIAANAIAAKAKLHKWDTVNAKLWGDRSFEEV